MFDEVYCFLKKFRNEGADDEKINQEAIKRFGKENMRFCFDIDQLIFMELF